MSEDKYMRNWQIIALLDLGKLAIEARSLEVIANMKTLNFNKKYSCFLSMFFVRLKATYNI